MNKIDLSSVFIGLLYLAMTILFDSIILFVYFDWLSDVNWLLRKLSLCSNPHKKSYGSQSLFYIFKDCFRAMLPLAWRCVRINCFGLVLEAQIKAISKITENKSLEWTFAAAAASAWCMSNMCVLTCMWECAYCSFICCNDLTHTHSVSHTHRKCCTTSDHKNPSHITKKARSNIHKQHSESFSQNRVI